MITIDKDVPLGPVIRPRKKASDIAVAIRSLDIGQSFFIDERPEAKTYYERRFGIKLKTRAVQGGFRVWRVA